MVQYFDDPKIICSMNARARPQSRLAAMASGWRKAPYAQYGARALLRE
jgi:hypothetical protein